MAEFIFSRFNFGASLVMRQPDLRYPDEKVFRSFAKWYNAKHAGRRVSWRRLNRLQRAAANRRFRPWHYPMPPYMLSVF